MDIEAELEKLEKEEDKTAHWIRYFIDEINKLKKDIDGMKKREEILAQSILKFHNEKEL